MTSLKRKIGLDVPFTNDTKKAEEWWRKDESLRENTGRTANEKRFNSGPQIAAFFFFHIVTPLSAVQDKMVRKYFW